MGTNEPSATPSSMSPSRSPAAARERRPYERTSFSPRVVGKWYSPAFTGRPKRAVPGAEDNDFVAQGLSIDEFSRKRMDATDKELREERDGVKDLI